MNKIIKKLLDSVYPKGLVCIGCGNELTESERKFSLCEKCFDTFIPISDNFELGKGIVGASCFEYDKIVRKMILSYKDSNQPYIAEYIAKFMVEKFLENNFLCDGLVFVPSNKTTIRTRGYDALQYVAKNISLALDLPIIYGIKKQEHICDLAQIEIGKRKDAIKDAFFIDNNNPNFLKRNILLIDDVITTGSTLLECVKVLKNAGANNIVLLTFASAR
ncbi:MAG: phosphoribosyltransferase family protein [Clostridia bacterium]